MRLVHLALCHGEVQGRKTGGKIQRTVQKKIVFGQFRRCLRRFVALGLGGVSWARFSASVEQRCGRVGSESVGDGVNERSKRMYVRFSREDERTRLVIVSVRSHFGPSR